MSKLSKDGRFVVLCNKRPLSAKEIKYLGFNKHGKPFLFRGEWIKFVSNDSGWSCAKCIASRNALYVANNSFACHGVNCSYERCDLTGNLINK